jgi:hypothetical protein
VTEKVSSDFPVLHHYFLESFNLKNPNIRETEIDFEILIKIGFHFFFIAKGQMIGFYL